MSRGAGWQELSTSAEAASERVATAVGRAADEGRGPGGGRAPHRLPCRRQRLPGEAAGFAGFFSAGFFSIAFDLAAAAVCFLTWWATFSPFSFS